MSKTRKIRSGFDKNATQDRGHDTSSSSKLLFSLVIINLLLALVSRASLATLAPVYGSLPTSINNSVASAVLYISCLLVEAIAKPQKIGEVLQALTVVTAWIPVVQLILFPFSSQLGVTTGIIIQNIISCFIPVLMVSLASAMIVRCLPRRLRMTSVTYGAGLLFLMSDRKIGANLPIIIEIWNRIIGHYSPVALQLLATVGFAIVSSRFRSGRGWTILLALPAILHTAFFNPHFESPIALKRTSHQLAAKDWLLLDRKWSTTGYLSVLENIHQGYRVLRCDHSLLGGDWLLTHDRQKLEGWKVNEPIYSVFEMLEAVRLIEVDPPIIDSAANALVVGLGIGTAPKALITHGISTTILELDPIVHEFAIEYFDLPKNHTAVIGDGIAWIIQQAAQEHRPAFDYIIHDVFTGGAEPLELFTFELIGTLRLLLKPHGVIALNYAGDLHLPLTTNVLSTINVVFDGTCKAFRDNAVSKPNASSSADFANFVLFCRNDGGLMTFRKPRKADFLNSKSRQHYLLPKAEQHVALPTLEDSYRSLLYAADTQSWRKQQLESARRHWKIMRTVMPDFVWEMW